MMKRFALISIALVLLATSLQSCRKHNPDDLPENHFDHVMILYSAGCNSLSAHLASDIQDLLRSGQDLPKKQSGKAVIIVSQKKSRLDPTSAYIIRARRSSDDRTVCDTLKVLEPGVQIVDPAVMKEVLGYIKEHFPSSKYGMIFSSHATGWLPKGYYDTGVIYDSELKVGTSRLSSRPGNVIPYYEPFWPGGVAVKSIGQGVLPGDAGTIEMSLSEFADAIPMKLDYLLFDACFMGGIEAAYEFRGKTRLLGGSQTEILADGFVYSDIVRRLIGEYDPQKVCEDFFEQYNQRVGINQSATISLIDCDKTDFLAEVCAILFKKYRQKIASVDPSSIQGFYRGEKHWFYDLEDIFVQSGISDSDHAMLTQALKHCVIYEAHTEKFMMDFPILTDCGLSMYLPGMGSYQLDRFYKKLAWNKVSGLVE